MGSVMSNVAVGGALCCTNCLSNCCGRFIALGTIKPHQCKIFFIVFQLWTMICGLLWYLLMKFMLCGEANGGLSGDNVLAKFFRGFMDYGIGLSYARGGYKLNSDGSMGDYQWDMFTWEDKSTVQNLGSMVPYIVMLSSVFFMIIGMLFSFMGSGADFLLRFWVLKFTIPLVLPFLFFWLMPTWGYWFPVAITVLFLMIQMILLYGSGFRIQDWLKNKQIEDQRATIMEDEGEKWYKAVFIVSFSCVFVSLLLAVFLSIYYSYQPGWVHILIWSTFLISLLLGCVACTSWCRHGMIMPSSMMMIYFQWLVWVALQNAPIPGAYELNKSDSDYAPNDPMRVIVPAYRKQFTNDSPNWAISQDESFTMEYISKTFRDETSGAFKIDWFALVVGIIIMITSLFYFDKNPDLLMGAPNLKEDPEDIYYGADDGADGYYDSEWEQESGGDNSSDEEKGSKKGRKSKSKSKKVKLPPADPCASGVFFLIHISCAFYLYTLITCHRDEVSFFIVLGTLVFNMLLYTWSLVWPYLRGGQEEEDDFV